jgi:hypothetical protein
MYLDREVAVEVVREKFEALEPVMDERMRRLWAAAEARGLGHGGITMVAEATGLTRQTITDGVGELNAGPDALAQGVVKVRRRGGGRKPLTYSNPRLLVDQRMRHGECREGARVLEPRGQAESLGRGLKRRVVDEHQTTILGRGRAQFRPDLTPSTKSTVIGGQVKAWRRNDPGEALDAGRLAAPGPRQSMPRRVAISASPHFKVRLWP